MCYGCAYWKESESEGMTYSDFGHADFKAPPERPARSNGLCVSGGCQASGDGWSHDKEETDRKPPSLDSAAAQWLTALEIPRTSGLKGS